MFIGLIEFSYSRKNKPGANTIGAVGVGSVAAGYAAIGNRASKVAKKASKSLPDVKMYERLHLQTGIHDAQAIARKARGVAVGAGAGAAYLGYKAFRNRKKRV